MHDKHLSDSTINTAKSAISTFAVSQESVSQYSQWELRIMKGLFVLNPPRPRYTAIWVVKIVLQKWQYTEKK